MAVAITFFQKLLSYLVPVTVLKTKSTYNPVLEVAVENGVLVLNSANANYSYGSLFRVFKKAFDVFKIDVTVHQNILLLGMGAGSVAKYIAQKNPDAKIDAVEIDESVIAIAEQVFKINTYKNIRIIHADAQAYLAHCTGTYHLVLVDLFVDDLVPQFCITPDFATAIKNVLAQNGLIVFNLSMNKNQKVVAAAEAEFKKLFSQTELKTVKGNAMIYAS